MEGREYECKDHGPKVLRPKADDEAEGKRSAARPEAKYVGFRHMCSLSNMIPLRNDVHAAFDAHQIGIDVKVRVSYALVRVCTHLNSDVTLEREQGDQLRSWAKRAERSSS